MILICDIRYVFIVIFDSRVKGTYKIQKGQVRIGKGLLGYVRLGKEKIDDIWFEQLTGCQVWY